MGARDLDVWADHLGVGTDDEAIRVLNGVAHRLDEVANDLAFAGGVIKGGPDADLANDIEAAWGRALLVVDGVRAVAERFARHERGGRG
jgi:hypothetical protein